MTSVLILCPVHGRTMLAPTTDAIVGTVIELAKTGRCAGFATYSHTGIADSRSMLLTAWYDLTPEATHLLMVDSDMSWPPRLITEMLDWDEPVVGTLYASRNEGFPPIGRADVPTPMGDGWRVAHEMGAGILLIRRDAVERLLRADPDLVVDAPHLQTALGLTRIIHAFREVWPLSEDLSFCARCRESGINMIAWNGQGVVHWGWKEFQL
jgi:hypothetical protein